MKFYKIFITILAITFAPCANALELKAKNAVLMDYDTGQYLYTKNAFTPLPPASMSKLMTVYIIFEKLKDGSLSLDDTFVVSENAWKKGGAGSGGSTMFLPIKSKVTVEDLIKGIIIQSGNDACIVVAENIAGSEANFAEYMNIRAIEIGLKNSNFANSTGLPHPDHKMSMEDLALLSKLLIQEFPDMYYLFSEKSFEYNGIKQGNRNPLLYSMPEADGLKTGHTQEAGFALASSAKRGDMRLIAAMSGIKSSKERSEEAERLMNWGFREFKRYKIFEQYQPIISAPVYMGVEKSINLVANEDVTLTLARRKAKDVKLVATYQEPIKAPIKMGDKLGYVTIEIPDTESVVVPLYADKNIQEQGFWGRITSNIKYLIFGDK